VTPVSPLPLLVILGPTAAGKTALAVELGERLRGEVISADSRQVYRGMDIGTAKPTAAQRSAVPHHLLDLVNPDESLNLGDYLRLAGAAIQEVRSRRRVPMLVGGSAQYVWALVENWQVPAVAPNAELRLRLAERADQEGAHALHQELEQIDPLTARDIHPNNVRRVIRALELHAETGQSPSLLRRVRGVPADCLIIGVRSGREALYRRIDSRVEAMFEAGLIAEVQALLDAGYDPSLPSMSGIGYTQVVQLLRREINQAEAVERTQKATHRLARQQSVWFRADDKRIHWIEPGDVQGALDRLEAQRSRAAHV
jgi:tRNA dimethylallyltransferase